MMNPSPAQQKLLADAAYYKPPSMYSTGVLIGNWVENTIECPKGGTFYFPPKEVIDYEKFKPQTRAEDNSKNKLNSKRGTGVYITIGHDSHKNCANYASCNDIVYNVLPKPLCGPEMRYYKKSAHQYYPQPDLMQCYGNVSNFGLRAAKRYEWACTNVSDYATTLNEDTYVAPRLGDYLKNAERRARDSSFTKQFRFKMTKPLQKKPKKND